MVMGIDGDVLKTHDEVVIAFDSRTLTNFKQNYFGHDLELGIYPCIKSLETPL